LCPNLLGNYDQGVATVGEAIQSALCRAGVSTVFGIPGVHTIELFRSFDKHGLDLVVPRHEQGAGFMADGYARVTGKPGVCFLITGPGVTNAMTPVGQAYHDSVPLLVLASETSISERGNGQGPLHDLPDQTALMSCITAHAGSVRTVEELPGELQKAWDALHRPRPRPVYLGVPHDLLGQQCPFPLTLSTSPQRPVPMASELDAVAELLAQARRPVIVLGGGAVDAGRDTTALAESLDAPIALTGNARGTVPSSHPLNLGATLPFAPTRAIIANADVVLLVGTQLSDVDVIYTGVPLSFTGAVVRVDTDPAQLSSGTDAAVGVLGDASVSLAGLAQRLAPGRQGSSRASAHAGDGQSGAEIVKAALGTIDWNEQSLGHLAWIEALDRALPRDRVIALDSTQLAYTALHALPVESPRSWLAPYGYGTLGPALPMAIGAKVGRPQAPVAVIAGDGGLLFTVAELATALDRRMNLPVVIWDNHGFGEIRDSFRRAGMTPVGCDVSTHDILAIGAGFGCATARAASPDQLQAAVAEALAVDRPTLIEVAA
jgi:thiamine pyrophosphate-dependent acetolactate synthase large subunit-like protein